MSTHMNRAVRRLRTPLARFWSTWKAWPGSQLGSLTLVLAVIIVVSSRVSPQFLTAYNITIVLRSLAFVGIVSLAQGMLLLLGDIDASIGAIWLLPSIAGPVIGGIAITGGIGSVTGALIGGAILGVIANIVVLGGVSLYWQQVINGAIVVMAIVFDSLSRRTKV